MSNTSFINLLRDYAAASKRRQRSYAEAVHALVDIRLEEIAKQNLKPEDMAAAQESARQTALREYGKVDSAFTFDSVG